jgi:hypothetical protein
MSSSAKADDPVHAGICGPRTSVRTGCSAGACPWARRRRDPGAEQDNGEAGHNDCEVSMAAYLRSVIPFRRHHPRKRMTEYTPASVALAPSVRTGCSAGACPWARRRRDPGAEQDNGEAGHNDCEVSMATYLRSAIPFRRHHPRKRMTQYTPASVVLARPCVLGAPPSRSKTTDV